jgi:hypothetical protein
VIVAEPAATSAPPQRPLTMMSAVTVLSLMAVPVGTVTTTSKASRSRARPPSMLMSKMPPCRGAMTTSVGPRSSTTVRSSTPDVVASDLLRGVIVTVASVMSSCAVTVNVP